MRTTDKAACKFCSAGAIWAVDGLDPYSRCRPASRAAVRARYFATEALTQCGFPEENLISFNEMYGRKKAQVLQVFDRAIKLAKAAAKK